MRGLLLVLLVSVPVAVCAQSPPSPVIRAKLVPADHILVGQPVKLEVIVLVPNYFTGAPDFPSFEMDGAIVTLSEDRPEHLNEQLGSVTYAGIRRFYLIYPEQLGRFEIPPIEVSVPFAAAPPETTKETLRLPPLHFQADLPPAARKLDYFLPTSQLTIREKWSAPLDQLRVGDSISRVIVVSAEKMRAMLIPPVSLPAPEGVKVYPKSPSVEDQKSPIGEFLQGVRTERASYLFEKRGDFTLPGVEVSWWDLAAQKVKNAKLPATTIHVNDKGGYVSELPPRPEAPVADLTPRKNWQSYVRPAAIILLVLAALTILLLAFRRWAPTLTKNLRQLLARRRGSEAAHWRRFQEACRQNDAKRSYATLLAWLNNAQPGATLDDLQRDSTDPTIGYQIQILSETLFAATPSSPWSGNLLRVALTLHRGRLLPPPNLRAHLPELNPENSRKPAWPQNQ
jgi:hypothetical protein